VNTLFKQLPWLRERDLRSGRYDCADCGINTIEIGHYYHVVPNVWHVAIRRDRPIAFGSYLCLVCLEVRMHRRLVPEDFSYAPINLCAAGCCKFAAERILGPRWKETLELVRRWGEYVVDDVVVGNRPKPCFDRITTSPIGA
jgi:hypothetical protein